MKTSISLSLFESFFPFQSLGLRCGRPRRLSLAPRLSLALRVPIPTLDCRRHRRCRRHRSRLSTVSRRRSAVGGSDLDGRVEIGKLEQLG